MQFTKPLNIASLENWEVGRYYNNKKKILSLPSISVLTL